MPEVVVAASLRAPPHYPGLSACPCLSDTVDVPSTGCSPLFTSTLYCLLVHRGWCGLLHILPFSCLAGVHVVTYLLTVSDQIECSNQPCDLFLSEFVSSYCSILFLQCILLEQSKYSTVRSIFMPRERRCRDDGMNCQIGCATSIRLESLSHVRPFYNPFEEVI